MTVFKIGCDINRPDHLLYNALMDRDGRLVALACSLMFVHLDAVSEESALIFRTELFQ